MKTETIKTPERTTFPAHWWHWIIETCPACKARGQMPIRDEFGEDCNLFDRLENLRANPGECCGPMEYTYRHALADHEGVATEFWRLQDAGKLEPVKATVRDSVMVEKVTEWRVR